MLCSNNGWFAGGAARGRGRLHVFCPARLQVLPAGPRMGLNSQRPEERVCGLAFLWVQMLLFYTSV